MIKIKVENFINGKEISFNECRITEDDKYVPIGIYNEACDILKQGLLTSEEIQQALALKQRFYKICGNRFSNDFTDTHSVVTAIIKLCGIDNAKALTKTTDYILQLEREYTVEHMKKLPQALNIQEHIEVMEWLLENTELAEMKNEKRPFQDNEYLVWDRYVGAHGHYFRSL